MKFLKGKKTYMMAALLVVVTGLRYQGVIDQNTFETLSVLLGAGSVAALRSGMKK